MDLNESIKENEHHTDIKIEEHPVSLSKQDRQDSSMVSILDIKREDHLILSDEQESHATSLMSVSDKSHNIACPYMLITKAQTDGQTTTDGKTAEYNLCGEGFSYKISLEQYMKIQSDKIFLKCKWCDKWFAKKKELHMHQREHTGKNLYQCNYCDKGFIRKSSLVTHQNQKHTNEKYQCSTCNKHFACQDYLEKHNKIHTLKETYKCRNCDYFCAKKYDMIIHQRKHTGEKPYQCNLCEKQFKWKPDMLKHQRKHSDNKSFHQIDYEEKVCISNVDSKIIAKIPVTKHPSNTNYGVDFYKSPLDRKKENPAANQQQSSHQNKYITYRKNISVEKNQYINIYFTARPPKEHFLLSRVLPNTEFQEMLKYIKCHDITEFDLIQVSIIDLMWPSYKSYMLSVNVCDNDKVMQPSIWPAGVEIQRWTNDLTMLLDRKQPNNKWNIYAV